MAGIPRKRYSDNEKAAALAALDACGGNYHKTAQETGVPVTNLREWDQGRGAHPFVQEQREEARESLDARLEQLAQKILDRALNEAEGCKLDQATFSQMMTGFGIAIDKMRLLREQATSITANLTDDERRTRISNLINTGAARSSIAAPNPAGEAGTGSATCN